MGIWRSIIGGLAAFWNWLMDWLAALSGRRWRQIGIVLIVAVVVFYTGGMLVAHRIADDTDFQPTVAVPDGGSRSVAMLISLVERELDAGWIPNNPWFYPSAMLDNTPNYQMGMIAALSRFSFELRDQIGRNRGSSASDPDLEAASGNLSKEGTTWIMQFPSLIPRTPSESYYREAIEQLQSYNRRISSGDAVFEKRSDNLMNTLDRIALDLGASSASIEDHILKEAGSLWFDTQGDDLFYSIKGQTYAYLMILKALRQDFAGIVESRDVGRIYDEMIASMERIVQLDPMIVMNGSTDGQVFPNHLAAQGFYLLRARTQLRELTNILLK